MDQAQQDIFAKLEAAIDKWSAEVAEAQSDLAREVARAKGLATGEQGSAVREQAPPVAAPPVEPPNLEPLVQLFRESFEVLRQSEARLQRWEETAQRLHSEVDALKAALEDRPSEPDPHVAEHLGALQAQLTELAKPRPEGPSSDEQQRLVGQIENLRADVALLREIVAGTPELDHGVADEIRALRTELGRIRENTARVAQLEGRIEGLAGLFKAAMAQLEHAPEEPASSPEQAAEPEPEPAPELEETVEVGADADLSAVLESFEEPAPDVAPVPPEPEEEPAPAAAQAPRFEAFGPDGSRRRLGEILLAAGVVSQDQLDRALAAQENHPQKHLGALLIEMGLTGEDVIAQTLACQVGLRYVKLDPEVIDQAAARRIRSGLALRHKCIPVAIEGDQIQVAMANPLDLIAIEDIERATSLSLEPLVASSADIMSAIEWCYGSSSSEI